MQKFMLRRLTRGLITLWGIVTIVFLLMRLSGDPASVLLPEDATPEDVQRLQHELGLDRPLIAQYGIFLVKLARFDFGSSMYTGEPAIKLVMERVPASLELAIAGFLLAALVGIPLGVLAATKPYSWIDNTAMVATLFGMSTPSFFLGIMLILVISLRLDLLPTGGRGTLSHLILPMITTSAMALASVARLTRSAILEIIHKDYIRTARSKGLRDSVVLFRHALKNAAIPIVTVMGIQLGAMLGGAVVTETVFAWPGIGRLAIQSILNRDYAVVQAIVLVIALAFVLINLAVDVLYAWLDPRIRYA